MKGVYVTSLKIIFYLSCNPDKILKRNECCKNSRGHTLQTKTKWVFVETCSNHLYIAMTLTLKEKEEENEEIVSIGMADDSLAKKN